MHSRKIYRPRSLCALLLGAVLLCFSPFFVPSSFAAVVRKDAFLSRLFEARGFATVSDIPKNSAAILKSGLVTEFIRNPAGPVTRREALRWMIQSLGLAVEAEILSGRDPGLKDAKALTAFERGSLVVATSLQPPLFKKTASFGPDHKISPEEAQKLLAAVRQASGGLKLEARFSPVPGMELELHRKGVFSALPKWRVYADGFDEKTEVETLQQHLATQGFKTEPGNPNYEWRLRSELFEDYSRVRRFAALCKAQGKSVRILPSLSNPDLENQPLYWGLLTIEPGKYLMEPMIAPGGITTLAPLSALVKANRAQAAINAGFFGVSGRNQGMPIGALRIRQALVSKPYQGRTCLGWNQDNRAAFGAVTWNGSVRLEEGWLSITALNHFAKGNSVTLYSPHYGKPTPLQPQVTEILVQKGRYAALNTTGGSVVEPGSFILAAYGTSAEQLAGLRPGEAVKIESSLNEGDTLWNGMDHIIQAGPFLVSNGEIRIEPEGFNASLINLRHPRSVIGLTDKGKWVFFVGDGRHGMHSGGFTLKEVAEILRERGVTYALNLDGGGSSQMMVGGKIYNYPSEGRERPISYALGVRAR